MAIKATAVESGVKRDTGAFFNSNQDFTYCYWFTPVQNPAALPKYLPVHAFFDTGGGFLVEFAEIDATTGALSFHFQVGGSSPTDSIPLVVGDSYFIAVTYDLSAQELKFYVNRKLFFTVPGADFTGIQFDYESFGTEEDGSGDPGTGFKMCRSWQACLTSDELAIESSSATPVVTTNIFANFPFATTADLADTEVTAANFTALGTIANLTTAITYITGVANTAATSAQNIAAANYHAVQNILNALVYETVWYSYTATASDKVIGIRAYGTLGDLDDLGASPYYLLASVFTGPASSPVAIPYLSVSSTNRNIPLCFSVTPGETYYIKLQQTYFAPTVPGILTIQLTSAPTATVPSGSLFVNNDLGDLPSGFLSASVSGLSLGLKYVNGVVSGEAGDLFDDGSIVLDSVNTPSSNQGTYNRYNNQVQFVEEVAGFSFVNNTGDIASIRTNQVTDVMYLGSPGKTAVENAKATTIDDAGVLGPTVWDLGVVGVDNIAPNAADTILYYGGVGTKSGTFPVVRRWDLVNDLPLGDFITGPNNCTLTEILVLSNDTIIVAFGRVGATKSFFIQTYNSAGVLLNSFDLSTSSLGKFCRLAYDNVSENFFWGWDITNADPVYGSQFNRFRRIVVASGAANRTIYSPVYEQGRYVNGVSDIERSITPYAAFGLSSSCPFLITKVSIGASATIQVNKVTVGGDDTKQFTVNAGGGLSPTSFTLADGESYSYESVTPGSGYSIEEESEADYTTTYEVSNGDLPSNITIGAGQTVIVTITNIFIGINPLSGIYKIIPNSFKTNDTIYLNLDPEETEDRAIPRPTFRTGLIGK